MAVSFERTIAGEFAYLDGRRDGAVLWWEKGTSVRFAFNRAGSSWSRVASPERFGGTPQTSAEFRRFAQRFASAGSERRRGQPGGGIQIFESRRSAITRELRRRRRDAQEQKRSRRTGRFVK